ncbi:MAG: LysE family translocator [Rhodospirillaceae bacterium]|nr:LysE family translocator [Rhodospirillaceae bacterium]
MTLASLLLFASVYFAVVALPGPVVTALVARTLARGPAEAPAFIAGVVTGSLIWFTLVAAGLSALAAQFGTLFLAIRYAGAAYLVYLAWKLWTSAGRTVVAPVDRAPEGRGRMFLTGLAINLGNPKALVFFVALLPSVVDMAVLTPLGAAEMAGVIVVVVSGVLTDYAVAAARARRLFASPRAVRLVNRGSSVALVGAAAAIAAR